MIDAHHDRARATGARIVPFCGFDSIPSDLGTLTLQEHARARHGAACERVRHYVSVRGGAISGGTAASMVQLMNEAAGDAQVRALLRDPYALDPGHVGRGPDGSDNLPVRYDADVGRWTGPFVMAAINARVVRRSNAMLDYAWGKDFRYREGASFALAASGLFAASICLGGSRRSARGDGDPGRAPRRRAPRAGARGGAVAREAREELVHLALRRQRARLDQGRPRHRPRRGRPGLRRDGQDARRVDLVPPRYDRASTRAEGGVLTPASCMGMTLVERLRKADARRSRRAERGVREREGEPLPPGAPTPTLPRTQALRIRRISQVDEETRPESPPRASPHPPGP